MNYNETKRGKTQWNGLLFLLKREPTNQVTQKSPQEFFLKVKGRSSAAQLSSEKRFMYT